jgi:hypothetical protein
MGKIDKDDPIADLREWGEHQYNPGYWINRFSPFFPPKRTKHYWFLAIIDVVFIIPFTLALLVLYINKHDPDLLIPLLLCLFLSVVSTLQLIRLRPLKRVKSQMILKEKTANVERKRKCIQNGERTTNRLSERARKR